jgi:hypothetical protein
MYHSIAEIVGNHPKVYIPVCFDAQALDQMANLKEEKIIPVSGVFSMQALFG